MAEIFQGWRLKAGVATLVMALTFMNLWIRGYGIKDTINFGSDHKMVYRTLETFPSGILWERSGNNEITQYAPGWDSRPLDRWERSDSHPYVAGLYLFHWRWRFMGFDFGSAQSQSWDGTSLKPLPPGEVDYATTYWFVPYWSLVAPTTVLSAILLLGKPGSLIPKKTSKPVPDGST